MLILCFYEITHSSIIVLNKNSHLQPEKGRFILDKNLAAQNIEISRFCCMTKIFILFDREFCTKITFNHYSLPWRCQWSYNTQIFSIYNGINLNCVCSFTRQSIRTAGKIAHVLKVGNFMINLKNTKLLSFFIHVSKLKPGLFIVPTEN